MCGIGILRPKQIVTLATALLILKVTAAIVAGYRNYFPPDFNADFLRGRESYFFGGYQWAFYAHIAGGPSSLLVGLLLMSDRFRLRQRNWHRYLGRFQAVCVLLVVAPTGLVMAFSAASGPIAGLGFTILAVLTGLCVALGWKSAARRQFAAHRRWMSRSFVLLCSAVVLRLAGGLAATLGIQSTTFDPIAAWVCWAVPLAVFELCQIHLVRDESHRFAQHYHHMLRKRSTFGDAE